MELVKIQEFYNATTARLGLLRVRAVFIHNETAIRGRYIQNPFPRIELVEELYTTRTIYHELLHHLLPDMKDGDEFEQILDRFISDLESNQLGFTNTGLLTTTG